MSQIREEVSKRIPSKLRGNLLKAAQETLERLGERYDGKQLYIYLNEGEDFTSLGIYTSNDAKTTKTLEDEYSSEKFEELLMEEFRNVLTVQFDDIDYDSKALTRPNKFSTLLKNRVVGEITAIMPSPKIKNWMYRRIGVNLPESKEYATTIAPKVLIDYLNPNLIHSGEGSIIGEGAYLTTHFFNPNKYVIGIINIGKRSIVGSKAVILPGSVLGDDTGVGVSSTVAGYLPSGKKINSDTYYNEFSSKS